MNRITILPSIVLLSTTLGCMHGYPKMNQSVAGNPIDAWAKVLNDYVNEDGQVDFNRLKKEPEALLEYLNHVAVKSNTDANFASVNHRLAFSINSYNAAAMYAVIRRNIPESNSGLLSRLRFFYLDKYRIGNKPQSLFAYERMIRSLGDERVHFALNCMSVGCPHLPKEPFTGIDLDVELDREARLFFASREMLVVDHVNQRVRVSEILKLYTPEFLMKKPSLIDYINQYLTKPIPCHFEVSFLTYDWTINNSSANDYAGPLQRVVYQ